MEEFQRWYDTISSVKEMFMVMGNMHEPEMDRFAKILLDVIIDFRTRNKTKNSLNSVGHEKIHGYYKAFNKRRWYDQNANLRNALRYLSIMSLEDTELVIRDFRLQLKVNGLDKIYEMNKTDLQKFGV